MVKGNSTANVSHGSHLPTPTKPGPATIKLNSDICPGTGDLGNFPCALINQSACNIACYANPLCSAFVLHTGTCYLKSCSGPIVPVAGSTVGLLPATPGRGPPPVSSLQNPVRCSSTAVYSGLAPPWSDLTAPSVVCRAIGQSKVQMLPKENSRHIGMVVAHQAMPQ